MSLRSLRKFWRQSNGTATVETVLWFPLFIAIFGLMLDVAMIFHGRAKILEVVQDGNRELSIGRLANSDATETYIETTLANLGIAAVADATPDSRGIVRTVVTVPAAQLQVLGYFTAFSNLDVRVSAEQVIEYWEG